LRIYLDSNAWISLINSESAIQHLIRGHQARSFEILVSQENLHELVLKGDIDTQTRTKNLAALKIFISGSVEDTIFVTDHSRLGLAQIGEETSRAQFELHINGKVPNSNNLSDGVHLVNAMNLGAKLISCDSQVQKSGGRLDRPVICPRAWFSEQHWDSSRLEICGCIES
jgi:predicted nucleic acid-binding protein